jgi:hypothetical protein
MNDVLTGIIQNVEIGQLGSIDLTMGFDDGLSELKIFITKISGFVQSRSV